MATVLRKSETRTKRAVFVLKNKGGQGATWCLGCLADNYAKLGKKVLLADGDPSATKQSLSWLYESAIQFDFVGDDAGNEALFNGVLSRGEPLVCVDFPAFGISKFEYLAGQYDVVDLIRELGYRPTIAVPVSPGPAGVYDLKDAIELFDPEAFAAFELGGEKPTSTNADFIACVNLGLASRGKRDAFVSRMEDGSLAGWDSPDCQTRKLLAFVGGMEVEIPRLDLDLPSALFHGHLTLAEAELRLPDITARYRISSYRNLIKRAFLPAHGLLGL